MKGFIYYTAAEAERNHGFIDDLKHHASKMDISLTLLLDEEEPDDNTDFILFRDRNPLLSKKWDSAGFRVFNRCEVTKIANDKMRTFELATLLGIAAVPTKKATSIHGLPPFPLVLKTIDGHGGNEVFLCHTIDEAEVFFGRFAGRQSIVQPFIESGATDVRVFMLGEDVLGAVKRTGSESFKSNFTLGGKVEKYTLSDWQEKEVRKIASALKSDYIGIDFLLLPDGGWMLNEIEDPVGARSLYVTHDFSVAGRLLEYVKKKLEVK